MSQAKWITSANLQALKGEFTQFSPVQTGNTAWKKALLIRRLQKQTGRQVAV